MDWLDEEDELTVWRRHRERDWAVELARRYEWEGRMPDEELTAAFRECHVSFDWELARYNQWLREHRPPKERFTSPTPSRNWLHEPEDDEEWAMHLQSSYGHDFA